MYRLVVPLLMSLVLATPVVLHAATPELPRGYVDTTEPVQAGHTVAVPAGGDFQVALNSAQPGDTLVLQSGAIFTGNYTLPVKPANGGWIIIRSSGTVPMPGSRVSPTSANGMAKIVAGPNGDAITAIPGAHHYRFIGIEFASSPSVFTYDLVTFGWSETSATQVPHHIVIDRCYVHGDPIKGGRRGISLNGTDMAVIDSYVSDFKEVGNDSQAVWGFNGPGPFKVVNNYLEAAGENLLFGGAAPKITNLVPSDIEIRHNLFSKPLSWKSSTWQIKNLLELKIAQRVLIDGNEIKNTWPAAQQGFSVLFTPRAEGGAAPQAVVQDITFSNNLVHDVAVGFDITGADSETNSTRRTFRIAVRNNLFYAVNGSSYGPGHFIVIPDGITDFFVEHNTVLDTGDIISADGSPTSNFVFQNNIIPHNDYGVASSAGTGNATLAKYFPGFVFTKNVIVTPDYASLYPSTNYFPATLPQVEFVDFAGGNYRLADVSPYNNAASDGTDLGVDFVEFDRAQAGGTPNPTPTPTSVATISPIVVSTAQPLATPTPVPVSTKTPTPFHVSTATSTPTRMPTRTPTPSQCWCYANGVWKQRVCQ